MGVAYVTVEALLMVVQGLLLLPATLWRTWNCLRVTASQGTPVDTVGK